MDRRGERNFWGRVVMSQTELSFGRVCQGTDVELLMSDVDNLKGIVNIGDFGDYHNNWVGTAIGRNFESHFEIDVVNLVLVLTIGFVWHYGQANENPENEDIRGGF